MKLLERPSGTINGGALLGLLCLLFSLPIIATTAAAEYILEPGVVVKITLAKDNVVGR